MAILEMLLMIQSTQVLLDSVTSPDNSIYFNPSLESLRRWPWNPPRHSSSPRGPVVWPLFRVRLWALQAALPQRVPGSDGRLDTPRRCYGSGVARQRKGQRDRCPGSCHGNEAAPSRGGASDGAGLPGGAGLRVQQTFQTAEPASRDPSLIPARVVDGGGGSRWGGVLRLLAGLRLDSLFRNPRGVRLGSARASTQFTRAAP